ASQVGSFTKHRVHIWEVGASRRGQVASVPILAALVDSGFKGTGEGGAAIPDVPASRAARRAVCQVFSGLKSLVWFPCRGAAIAKETGRCPDGNSPSVPR